MCWGYAGSEYLEPNKKREVFTNTTEYRNDLVEPTLAWDHNSFPNYLWQARLKSQSNPNNGFVLSKDRMFEWMQNPPVEVLGNDIQLHIASNPDGCPMAGFEIKEFKPNRDRFAFPIPMPQPSPLEHLTNRTRIQGTKRTQLLRKVHYFAWIIDLLVISPLCFQTTTLFSSYCFAHLWVFYYSYW
jgi:hypothetical protein